MMTHVFSSDHVVAYCEEGSWTCSECKEGWKSPILDNQCREFLKKKRVS